MIINSLCVHKISGVSEAVTACGAHMSSLLPYLPNFTSTELASNKFKTNLRTAQFRTCDGLTVALRINYDWIAGTAAKNCFVHCDYHIYIDRESFLS